MQKSTISFILFPLLLVLYEIPTYLSNDAYLPALPQIMQDLATSHSLTQLTLTTWFFGSASMQLVLGPVSDRFGRRPVLLIGGVVFLITALICAFTNNIWVLLVARFFQGATITSMIVAGYAAIHELFDQEKAIHTLAWMNSITVLAPSFGPLFGAFILYFLNWRWIFGVLVLWVGAVLAALFFKMPETNVARHQYVLQIGFIIKQYKNIFTNRGFLTNVISLCFLFGSMIAWIAAGPFLVISQFGYSPLEFGVLQVLVFGSYILATRLVKPLLKRIAIELLIKRSLSCALIGGMLALLLAFLFPDFLYGMALSMMLIAAGSGFAFPLLNRTAIECSDESMGMRVAVFSTLMSAFGAIGSVIVGIFYNGKLLSLAVILALFTGIAYLIKLRR